MHEALTPLVEKLRKKETPHDIKRPRFFDDAAEKATKAIDHIFSELMQEGNFGGLELLGLIAGETEAQRPPSKTGTPHTVDSKERDKGTIGKAWAEQDPKTLPHIEANREIPRRRLSYVHKVDYRAIEDPTIVSAVVVTPRSKEKTFVLNSNSPIVKSAVIEGDIATTKLMLLELADHIAQEYSTETREYKRFRDYLQYKAGLLLLASPDFQQGSLDRILIAQVRRGQQGSEGS